MSQHSVARLISAATGTDCAAAGEDQATTRAQPKWHLDVSVCDADAMCIGYRDDQLLEEMSRLCLRDALQLQSKANGSAERHIFPKQ